MKLLQNSQRGSLRILQDFQNTKRGVRAGLKTLQKAEHPVQGILQRVKSTESAVSGILQGFQSSQPAVLAILPERQNARNRVLGILQCLKTGERAGLARILELQRGPQCRSSVLRAVQYARQSLPSTIERLQTISSPLAVLHRHVPGWRIVYGGKSNGAILKR